MLVKNSVIENGLTETDLKKTRCEYESIVITINSKKKRKNST